MEQETVERLLRLNQQFYQTFAVQFSQTRQRLQPGVRRVLEGIPTDCTILDLGCGNGELWNALARRGFSGRYIGIDASPALLEIARQKALATQASEPCYICSDLASSGWSETLRQVCLPSLNNDEFPRFDFILAFAVLHHLPGNRLRIELLQRIRKFLKEEGKFVHSEWQFLNSERLRARLQPWSVFGMQTEWVEAGDYLLDWRHGGQGLRYVHLFQLAELRQLAAATGFEVADTFASDGKTGQLGLYQYWVPV